MKKGNGLRVTTVYALNGSERKLQIIRSAAEESQLSSLGRCMAREHYWGLETSARSCMLVGKAVVLHSWCRASRQAGRLTPGAGQRKVGDSFFFTALEHAFKLLGVEARYRVFEKSSQSN